MEKRRYLVVDFTWIESKTYREVMNSCKGIQLIYDILRKYVVRNNLDHKVSKFIYENYYSNNILASSVPYSHLNKLTGMSMSSIKRCIDTLVEANFMSIEPTSGYTSDKQNVFILGKVKTYTDGNEMPATMEFWKIDDVVSQEIYEARMKQL
jgi:hypothetical protein